MSTPSLTVVSSAYDGLSKPSRCRFLAKNSETEMSRCCFARSLALDRLAGSFAALAGGLEDFALALTGGLEGFALDLTGGLAGFALDLTGGLEDFALVLARGLADFELASARSSGELLLALDRGFAARLPVLDRGVELLARERFCPAFRAANSLLSAMSRAPPAGYFTRICWRSMPRYTAWERCLEIR